MRRLAGQAARHGGRVLHRLGQAVLAAAVVAAMAIAGVSWRLSQGPVQLAWLAPALQAAANADAPLRVTLGGAAVAWEGFRAGLDQPLDIRLTDVSVSDAAGRRILFLPHAAVSLAPDRLLLGRLVPRAIELDGARLHLHRAADGAIGLDLPAATPEADAPLDLPRLLGELAARPGAARGPGGPGRWSQLRRLRLRDAAIGVTDRQLGTEWSVPELAIDLDRHAAGGVSGSFAATLALGGQTARLAATAALAPDGRRTEIAAKLGQLVPADLAPALPQVAALAAVRAPLTLGADVTLGPQLLPEHLTLSVALGAGTLWIAQGSLPVVEAQATVQGAPAHLTLDLTRFVTAPDPAGARTTLRGHATLDRGPAGYAATAAVDLDRVTFADLPALWPAGLGGPGTRPWIIGNITDGLAHGFHVDLAATAPADLSDVTLTRLSGGGEGSDVTVHWLRPVPPIVHGAVRLNFLDPDTLELVASDGREVLGTEAIQLHGGRVLFTGLSSKDQFADITADLSGTLPGALALLGQPRIGLLARSPLPVRDAGGQFAGRVTVSRLPLRDDVKMDDLKIATTLKLTEARLAGLVAGRDLDHGALDLSADPNGLHLAGQATLAGIPAQLTAEIDFRAGPPTQVVQNVSVSGTLDATQLAALGVDAGPFLGGAAKVAAHAALRRNHTGQISAEADLAGATLTLAALNWQKPRGGAAQATARLTLDHDRIASLDALTAEGEGLHLAGSAGFADGRPVLLRLDRLALGSATELHGTLGLPAHPGEPWRAQVAGSGIDLTAALKRAPSTPSKPSTGPAYVLDARFDAVTLGPERTLSGIVAHAESDGTLTRALDVAGDTPGGKPFHVAIVPAGAGRLLSGNAADAGALLKAFDVTPDLDGGTLALTGHYDDTSPDHALEGRAQISDFRIRHAPALAKLLQAMTLYGVVDLMQGPGLGFSQLVAPFRLTGDTLDLHDARAFSASLGMTAKGRIDLARQELDLQGTIVPAYFFNSLLGDLPIVGKLFSPERGGGLFAATYSLRGPLADPRVGVNPLAALTPGFLRGVFGLLDRAAPPP